MPSLTCFNVRFTPKWSMIFLVVVAVLIFSSLGFWQLHRAEEKKHMLQSQVLQSKQEVTLWSPEQHLPLQYQMISLQGHYLPHTLLLDNQHHNHQFGYNVLSALELADGKVILVDRGWVPGDNSRRKVPQIKTPETAIRLQGSAYFPSLNQWILGPDHEEKAPNVTIIERLDIKLLSQVLQKKVYPFIIRLDKQDAYGFVREWAIVSMPPERHLGYALQWFAMALVILIIFVALNLKKKDEKTTL